MKEVSVRVKVAAGSVALHIVVWAFYVWTKRSLDILIPLDTAEKLDQDTYSSTKLLFYNEHPRIVALTFEGNATTSALSHNRSVPLLFNEMRLRGHGNISSNDKLIKPAKQIKSIPETIILANGTRYMQQCEPIEDWQTTFHPTCNLMHELNLSGKNVKYIGRGSIRSVWMVHMSSEGNNSTAKFEEDVVMKTLRLTGRGSSIDFDPQRYESHRRDAVISERLTSSPHIVDIYGFCGHSCINEPMQGKLPHAKRGTGLDKLKLALDAVKALVDLHSAGDGTTERNGVAAIVHRDITHRNYLRDKNGAIKLNDFNIARFPEWDKTTKTMCKFSKRDCGAFKAPEECLGRPLTEKIDIYSFGLILYYILVGNQPYTSPHRLNHSEIKQHIMDGEPPTVKDEVRNSKDIADQTILQLISECFRFNPDDRPTAEQIELVLSEVFSLMKQNMEGDAL